LENYIQLPFSIRELVGEWLTLAQEDRLFLGRSREAGVLGSNTVIGEEIWNCQHKFRVVCGPLSLDEFSHLLPGAESVAAMVAVVRNYVGDEFSWDLKLVLKKEEVPAIALGSFGQLGWTSWLGERTDESDAGDVTINVQQAVCGELAQL